MKIWVIGSKGFIGSHCVDYFNSNGHEVFCADVTPADSENYFQLDKSNTDFETLFQKYPADICINASGSAHVGFSFENPTIDFELNVLNVHKLLVAIRKFNPECKMINFSSAAVYGNPESLPIKETQSRNPLSPYGFHKLQSELLLKEYHRFFGLQTMSVRVFSAYGPGLKKQLFWDLKQKANQGNVELFGSGKESRDFIYIADLITAIDILCQTGPFDGSAFNIASGIETEISEAAAIFFKHLSPDIKFNFSGKQKEGDPDNWVADINELTSRGFTPQFSLDKGLQLTADWMKAQ